MKRDDPAALGRPAARVALPTRLRRLAPRVEAIEPKLLFSADLHPAGAVTATWTPDAQTRLVDSNENAAATAATATSDAASTAATRELVIVDGRLPDLDTLLAGFESSDTRHIDVVVLDPSRDGLEQMEEILAGRQGLSAIHLVGHGASGQLQLGSTLLDADGLARHAARIAAWGESLTEDGDLLLYGCDVAAGETGADFVRQLATITGADVAASTDTTGAARFGGNWTFENRVGAIETEIAFTRATQEAWAGTLATVSVSTTSDVNDGDTSSIAALIASRGADGQISLREAIIAANNSAGADTINFNIAAALVNGAHTINLATALPTITGQVTLDASTEPDAVSLGRPVVALTSNLSSAVFTLASGSAGSTIRGFSIVNTNGDGILIQSANNTVAGNYIGLDVNSSAGGTYSGIGVHVVNAAGSTIGGTTAADRNVISRHLAGISFEGASTTSGTVIGNYIGSDATGMLDRGNNGNGIQVASNASGVVIGGTTAAARNVIVWNGGAGVRVDLASNVTISGNWIGLAADGTTLVRNYSGSISITTASSNVTIGGTAVGAGNVLAGSVTGAGVNVTGGSTGVRILGNAIYGHGGLGIDLGGDGVTANDAGDGDSGANRLQNFPVLTSAHFSNGNARMIGTLNSTANTTFRIEFFANPSGGGDSSGYGEGRRYLGFVDVTTNGSGNASFDTVFAATGNNDVVTATATNATTGDTSEFGQNITATFTNTVPAITSNGGGASASVSVYENTTAVTTVVASDPDVPLQSLTYSITGGADASLFAINATTGALTFTSARDYENRTDANLDGIYVVTVTASDGTATTSQTLNVTVMNAPQTITVTTTNDTVDGDTSSIVALLANMGSDGFISLREAILAANNTPNDNGVVDTIRFNIAAALVGGAHVITLTSALPSLTDAVVIDGTTEPDFTSSPVVRIDGNSAGAGASGLTLAAGSGGSTIRGLAITRFAVDGIVVSSSGNTIAGNYIGISTDGTTNAGNSGNGVRVTAGASNNVIGGITAADRNVISFNASSAVLVTGAGTDANAIRGNYIGLRSTGVSVAGNRVGITISAGATNTVVGGTAAGAGNVIGAAAGGVIVDGAATTGTVIQGNYIGLQANGSTASANSAAGVIVRNGASNVLIGGTAAGARNVIGTSQYGVYVQSSSGVTIQGNYLGVAADGTTARANQNQGVYIAASSGVVVGGTAAGAGNVISGNNGDGIAISGATANGNTVQGNLIGVAANGTTVVANGGAGVYLSNGAYNNMIGGLAATAGNVIAGNAQSGIVIMQSGGGNSFLRNRIYNNTGIGIDLGFDGVTANDTGDGDSGANHLQNFPVITTAGTDGSTTVRMVGTLNSTANTTFRIEFFASAAADASGYGEGERYLGSVDVTTDGSGNASFDTTFAGVLAVGESVSGIATHQTTNSSSEFSQARTATALNSAPVITSNGGGATAGVNVAENTTAVTTVTATDVDTPAQTLTFSISGGADAARFAIDAATGVLTFVAPPDFEAPVDANGDNVYVVIVQVDDGNGSTDTQTISVTVTNVNEAPVITSNGGGASAGVNVAENTTAVTTVTATDVDAGTGFNYTISGGADAGRFTIDATTGVLTFSSAPDFENPLDANGDNVYVVVVQVSDGNGGTDTQTISVTVTDVNDAPVISSNGGGATANVSVAENTTAVTTVTATDADAPAQTLAYSISGGSDAARFSINASTGVLTFNTAPNFEAPTDSNADNVYVVTVRVSDGNGGIDTQTISVTVTDANDAPVITSNGGGATANVNVAENGTAVTTVTATDADAPAQTLTYSINGGADAGHFAINGATGVLTFIAPPNFEAPTDANGDNVYIVTVQVSDGNGGIDTQTISVTVTNVNEAPVITSNGGGSTASTAVAENTTAVTTVTASDPDAGTSFAYSISGGADAGRFTINAATGVLSFSAPPNFESPQDANADNVYIVTVRVSDGNGGFATQTISVTVTDVNEAPVITSNGGGATGSALVTEGTTAVTTVTAADPDAGASLTYTITGGADAAFFTIDASTGALSFLAPPAFASPLDANGDNVYEVTVQVSDGIGGTDAQVLSVNVTDTNQAPTITSNGGSGAASVSVAENTTAVTTVTATDPDVGTTFAYSITGGADAGRFTIDASTGVLTFTTAPDHEAPSDVDGDNVYEVTLTVSDGSGGTDSQTLSVTVTNVNEAPVITSNGGGASGSASVAENTTAVTTVVATDPDAGASLTYAIVGGADAGSFTLNASTGALSFTVAPNFEAPGSNSGTNVYVVQVQVSDGLGGTDTQTLTVTVTDVNEAPVITSNGGGPTASTSVDENTTFVTTVTATDVDGNTVGFSIVGGADAARFTIDAATGALSFVTAPDFEAPGSLAGTNAYLVQVQANDGNGGTVTQTITVNVADVNEAPVITSNGGGASASVSVAENTTAVTTVTASDPDAGATLGFSLAGGADAGRFTINATTGVLTFSSAPDFENPLDANADNVYVVIVQVSDGNGGIDTQTISVTVTNVNENPVITSNGGGATTNVSVAENTTAVTTVTATDPDAGTTFSYALSGGADAARFTINATTGVLSFQTAPNFEAPADANADNVYVVTVRVNDGAGGFTTQTISVTVTDVNEAPVITSNGGGATGSVSVAENTTAVTTVTATDVDAGTTFGYSISGGADAARFIINPTTGALSFLVAPDFEAPTDANGDNVYEVTVQVSDGNGGTDTQALSVTVTNVNESPVITSNGGGATAGTSVAENTTAVTTVTATDVDAGTTFAFSIAGGADAARFTIDAATGALSFATAPNFEAPADADGDNVYLVTVQVSDGNGGVDTQTISVTVTDVNEAPTITSNGGGALGTASVAENTTAVTTVTATDPDAGTTFSYAIAGGADAARFTINAATGVLSFVTAPNFEAPADADGDNVYELTILVSDGNGGTTAQALSVTVTDVNEAPAITSNGGGATGTASVAEGNTAVTTVTAADPDAGATLTYAIAGGADASRFTIDAATGVLTFVTAPDFQAPVDANSDNVYEVTVTVSDGLGGTDSQALSVTVTNVNQAPVITSNGGGALANVSVAENTAAVTTVTATDVDAGTTFSYLITGGADAGRFNIDASTGVLTFLVSPDFEAPADADGDNVYELIVEVSDGAGGTDVQALRVTVTDANDAPVFTSGPNVSTAEDWIAVSTVTATDPDAGATLTYSIVGGADAARFTIDANTGVLTFVVSPDFESPSDVGGDNVYNLTIQVSDGTLTATQAMAITVTDINEAPVFTSGPNVGALENSTAVATVTAIDPDAGATLSYSIVGGADAARFTIDATTGVLRFVTAPDFEAPADAGNDNVYNVTVQVSDGTLTMLQAMVVTVGNVNEAPAVQAAATRAGVEDTPLVWSTAGGNTIRIVDVDASTTTVRVTLTLDRGTWALSGTSGLTFLSGSAAGGATATFTGTLADINAALDGLVMTPAADDDGTVLLRITVDDQQGGPGNGLTAQATITIALAPVNDAPVLVPGQMTVLQNGSGVLTSAALSSTDIDSPASAIRYTVVSANQGWLARAGDPNTAITSFTAAELSSGDIVYVHAGGTLSASLTLQVDDGQDTSAPGQIALTIAPRGADVLPGGPSAPPSGDPVPVPDVKVVAPTAPTPPPSGGPLAVAPTDRAPGSGTLGGEGTGIPPDGGIALSNLRDTRGGTGLLAPPVDTSSSVLRRVGAETFDVAGQLLQQASSLGDAALVRVAERAELDGLDIGHGRGRGRSPSSAGGTGSRAQLLEDEGSGEGDAITVAYRVGGIAVSLGTLYWALRASGILASVLATAPAWRNFDPLPVLFNDDDQEPEPSPEIDDVRGDWLLDEAAGSAMLAGTGSASRSG